MKDISGTKIFCMALTALMFSLIFIPAGSAAIGVKKGNWAKYRVEVVDGTEWVKFEVQNVSDTTVTLEETTHFKDGTEETETMDGIELGLIIEANLTEGDQVTVPMSPEDEMTIYINGTVSRKYAGASREVNYVDITVTEDTMTTKIKTYWDKATGILCEMSISAPMGYTMSFKMTETDMWEAEAASFITQWWFWAIIAVIIIVAAGSAVLLRRRRKPPLPEVAPAHTEKRIYDKTKLKALC